jgi:hypothetical protein
MSSVNQKLAILAAVLTLSQALFAQAPATQAKQPGTRTANPVPEPEPPLAPKSPIEFFRELLAMDVGERHNALADRSPENRKLILAKVRQYESLNADQRELRLRVTELRWYLLPLMKAPATNRAAQLDLIPADIRKLIEDRLREWDKLPTASQTELLDNEVTMRYLTEIKDADEDERRRILATLSEARRELLLRGLDRWGEMSESQRQQMTRRFDQFFELTTAEKERTLGMLSEPERRQMEKTLRVYSTLTSAQRAQCLRSFQKFANLDLAERQQFLKNAERWKQMKPAERQSWRELVNQLPLVPPDVELPPVPRDPKPVPRHPPVVGTNN